MMKTTIAIFGLLLFVVCGNSQSRKIVVPAKFKNDSISSFSFRELDNDLKQLGLDNLYYKYNSINFRFWTDCQMLDIKLNKDGQVICDLYSFVCADSSLTFFCKIKYCKQNIDSSTSLILWKKILELGLINLRTDSEIHEWVNGYGGTSYQIEYSSDTIYKFSSYWQPSDQCGIMEAKKIQDFYIYADELINLNNRFDKLGWKRPFTE